MIITLTQHGDTVFERNNSACNPEDELLYMISEMSNARKTRNIKVSQSAASIDRRNEAITTQRYFLHT